MADFSLYFPTLLKHEGGYVDNPNDKGGPTNLGITLKVWIQNGYDKDGDKDIDKYDLKLITPDDAEKIAKRLYWDKIKGDDIKSQSIAELLFDFAYHSGPTTAIKKTQVVLGLDSDGIFGPKTLAAINGKAIFDSIKKTRETYLIWIADHDLTQKKFLKGWLSRVKSFIFKD